jgi:hypothetical protein
MEYAIYKVQWMPVLTGGKMEREDYTNKKWLRVARFESTETRNGFEIMFEGRYKLHKVFTDKGLADAELTSLQYDGYQIFKK